MRYCLHLLRRVRISGYLIGVFECSLAEVKIFAQLRLQLLIRSLLHSAFTLIVVIVPLVVVVVAASSASATPIATLPVVVAPIPRASLIVSSTAIIDGLVAKLRIILRVALPLLQFASLLVIRVIRGRFFEIACISIRWLLLLFLIGRDDRRVLLLKPIVWLGLLRDFRSLDNLEVFDLVDLEDDGWDSVFTSLDFIFAVSAALSTERTNILQIHGAFGPIDFN